MIDFRIQNPSYFVWILRIEVNNLCAIATIFVLQTENKNINTHRLAKWIASADKIVCLINFGQISLSFPLSKRTICRAQVCNHFQRYEPDRWIVEFISLRMVFFFHYSSWSKYSKAFANIEIVFRLCTRALYTIVEVWPHSMWPKWVSSGFQSELFSIENNQDVEAHQTETISLTIILLIIRNVRIYHDAHSSHYNKCKWSEDNLICTKLNSNYFSYSVNSWSIRVNINPKIDSIFFSWI